MYFPVPTGLEFPSTQHQEQADTDLLSEDETDDDSTKHRLRPLHPLAQGERANDHALPKSLLMKPTTPSTTSPSSPALDIHPRSARCNVCHDLNTAHKEEWRSLDDHHQIGRYQFIRTTISAIRFGAQNGCLGCKLIFDGILQYDEKLSEENERDLVREYQALELGEDIEEYLARIQSVGDSTRSHKLYGCLSWAACDVFVSGSLGQAITVHWKRPMDEDWLAPIEFYTHKDEHFQPFTLIGEATDICKDLTLERVVEIARSWIMKCGIEHIECAAPTTSPLPTRIIDVGSMDTDDLPRLYQTNGEISQYCALSYCWGKDENLTTTRDTLARRMSGIMWAELPKTFWDAIKITKMVGIRYLWIDALCIIQDDLDDWTTEASNMASVYQGAFLTLCASASGGANGGCILSKEKWPPKARDFAGSLDLKVHEYQFSSSAGQTSSIYLRHKVSHRDIVEQPSSDDHEPLLSRAWALQERLLSYRMLHFTERELIWECQSGMFCECGGLSNMDAQLNASSSPWLPKALFNHIMKKNNESLPVSWWCFLVSEYSQRKLTRESDKLPALAGIVASIQDAGMGTYVAGLWQHNLPFYLCWQRTNISSGLCRRISSPSWTWASISGRVNWIADETDYPQVAVEVQEPSCSYKSQGSNGQAISERLILRGKAITATVRLGWDKNFGFDVAGIVKDGELVYFQADVTQWRNSKGRRPPENCDEQLEEGDLVTCMHILSSSSKEGCTALVLRPSKRIEGAFDRIGVTYQSFNANDPQVAWFANADVITLTVV